MTLGQRWRLASPALQSAVAPLLPSPIAPVDVAIFSARAGLAARPSVPAAMVVGHLGQRNLGYADLVGLPQTISFRALPGFGVPRALIPSPVAAAAEQLAFRTRAEPASVRLKIRAAVASQAIGFAWPRVSTPLRVHLPSNSPLVERIRAILPRSELGVFVGNGHNLGRSTVQAFASDGELLAVCRFITDPVARAHALREYELLGRLQRRTALRSHIPTPHDLVHSHLGAGVITNAFKGESGPTHLTGALADWLALCVSPDLFRASSSSLIRRLLRQAASSSDRHRLQAIATPAAAQLETETVARTLVHGDFTPWNMLIDGGQLRLFDWEYGTEDGLPDWDSTYYHLQVGLVDARWSAEQLLAEAQLHGSQPSEYLSPRGRAAITVLVVLEIALRSAERGDDAGARSVVAVAEQLQARFRHL